MQKISSSASIMAENYQLKWHSHGTYLHTMVATLQKTRSFTDVTLCTMEGKCLYAHRFILSACSKYFNKVLQQSYNAPSIYPLVIVLPAEIGYRTLGILLQYMYCGEATVASSQLNNVLKAGDLLQVRGLYQESKDTGQNIKVGVITTQQQHQSSTSSNGSAAATNSGTPMTATHRRPVSPTDHKYQKPMVKYEKTINTNNAPGKLHDYRHQSSQQQQQNHQQHGSSSTDHHYHHNHHNNQFQHLHQQQHQQHSVQVYHHGSRSPINRKQQSLMKIAEQISVNSLSKISKSHHEEALTPTKSMQSSCAQSSGISVDSIIKTEMHMQDDLPSVIRDGPETLITVKDEPLDWQDYESNDYDGQLTIQPEVSYASPDEQDDTDNQFYAPLICDVCNETFTSPSLWVRHVKTHEDLVVYQGIKKIKVELEDGSEVGSSSEQEYKSLRCELCQEVYSTPAEWVKHIEDTHANEQTNNLIVASREDVAANSNLIGSISNKSSGSGGNGRRRCLRNRLLCLMCNKTFPSQASIMIHIRSHTGEKPYRCTVCEKGFNVKSNLLRHMRTLHDSFVTPESISRQPNNNSDVNGNE